MKLSLWRECIGGDAGVAWLRRLVVPIYSSDVVESMRCCGCCVGHEGPTMAMTSCVLAGLKAAECHCFVAASLLSLYCTHSTVSQL